MTYFLYGQDTYRLKQKLAEIIERYKQKNKNCFNLKFFEGDKLVYQDFKEEFQQVPIFKEKKLAVLKNALANQGFKDLFLENAGKFIATDDIIVFCEEKEAPAKDALVKLLIKEGKSQYFPLLSGNKLKNWILKEFINLGVKADAKAADKLLEFLDNDLWQVSNEIKKLAAFKKSSKTPLSVKEVVMLVNPKTETDIFKTIDAIAQRNKEKALILLHKHLEKGDAPLYLLSMINFQFRNILIVKDLLEKGMPLGQLKLHPFVVRKSQQQAQQFTLEELKKIYHKIFKADFNIKTGIVGAEMALDLLVAEI
ncbi:MAG: DNA polymerase III subunit delta [Candidatus Nealsonbacteria bacterium]|nr:DNA polymerase III subunit delta [Candidatus Nealsonbacteria bacterium]